MRKRGNKKLTRLVLAAIMSIGGGQLVGNRDFCMFGMATAEAATVDKVETKAQADLYTGDGGDDLTITGDNGTLIDAVADANDITIGMNTAGNAPNGKMITMTGNIMQVDMGKKITIGLGEGSTWYVTGNMGNANIEDLYLDGGVIDAATYYEGMRYFAQVGTLHGTGTYYAGGTIADYREFEMGYVFEGSNLQITTMAPGSVLNVGVRVTNPELTSTFTSDPIVTSGSPLTLGTNIKAVPYTYGSKTYNAELEVEDAGGAYTVLLKSINVDGSPATSTTNENTMTAADSKFALNSLFLAETNNLQKRMGELRGLKPAESGAWARFGHGDLKPSDGRAAEAKYSMVQVGYDWDKSLSDGVQYQGFAVSHMSGSSWFAQGNGDLRETTLSLYRTWVGKRGHYYDVIAKVGEYSDDYKVWPNLGDPEYAQSSSRTWAYSISGEYGYRHALPNNTYIEPSGELILGRMNGVGYTIQDDEAHVDAVNHAIVRLGAAYGANLAGDKANVYLKANYFHDFGGGVDVRYGDTAYNRDGVRNWWEFAVGGNVKAGDNCNVYAELAKNIGDLRSDVKVNLGVRVSF